MFKGKTKKIDLGSVSELENLPGTNMFTIHGKKYEKGNELILRDLTIEFFNSATKISILPMLQKLCGM